MTAAMRCATPGPAARRDRVTDRRGALRGLICYAAMLVLAAASSSPGAQEARNAFRPCIDPANLPFANTKGEGFENRIADLFAKKLGLPVQN